MATTLAAPRWPTLPRAEVLVPAVVLAGRILYSIIFVLAPPNHFSRQAIAYAAKAGAPAPGVIVPLFGLIALAGGLSILLGWHARIGAILLVIFLVPVTLTMHRFWSETDPMMAAMQTANFLKNVSMLGGALLISCFGAGPWSFDARRERAHGP